MRLLTAVLALSAAFPLLAADKAPWHKATLKGTRAQVQFPAKPTEEPGKGGMVSLSVEVPNGNSGYMAMMNPSPGKIDLTDKDAVKKALDGGRDACVKALKGKVLAERDITLGKYPGRAMDIQWPHGLYRSRVYLTGGRVYQVIVFGPKDHVESADAAKFLDSLTIGD